MALIYEDDFYRATLTQPQEPVHAAGAVIFFSSVKPIDPLTNRAILTPVPQANFITNCGLAGVFVESTTNEWYQNDSIIDCAAEIRAQTAHFGARLSYGTSMGGFAAVAFADQVGADLFLVGSPQVSLSNNYLRKIGERRWGGYRDAFTKDIIRDGRCRNMHGIVAFDPMHREDRIHAQAILRHSRAVPLHCHGTDHFAIERLVRDIGWQRMLPELIHCAGNAGQIAQWADATQRIFDTGAAANFLAADDPERWLILQDKGPKALLAMMSIHGFVSEFARTPTPGRAAVLIALLPHLASPAQANYVRQAIYAGDMDHLLPDEPITSP